MKRIIAFLLSLVLLFTVYTGSAQAGANYVFAYMAAVYNSGGMLNGPPTLIGDPTGNNTIDAADALLTLVYAITGSLAWVLENGEEESALRQMEYYSRLYYLQSWPERIEQGDWTAESHIHTEINPVYNCYTLDSYFVCDVTNDCRVNAEDALMILQYAVGKREAFPRTDYTGQKGFQYMRWPAEWYPTMYYDMRVKDPAYYDSVARYFPEIPPMDQP